MWWQIYKMRKIIVSLRQLMLPALSCFTVFLLFLPQQKYFRSLEPSVSNCSYKHMVVACSVHRV